MSLGFASQPGPLSPLNGATMVANPRWPEDYMYVGGFLELAESLLIAAPRRPSCSEQAGTSARLPTGGPSCETPAPRLLGKISYPGASDNTRECSTFWGKGAPNCLVAQLLQ